LPRIAFVCGAKDSQSRERLLRHIARQRPDTLAFKADDVWERLSSDASLAGVSVNGAQALESGLAAVSDIVIIIVESPGTIAELGAFAQAEPLRRKLMAIQQIQYKVEKSFINSGPVRWIDADSVFRPVVWTDLNRIEDVFSDVGRRLDLIHNERGIEIKDCAKSPKHALFVLLDLVSAIGPATRSDIAYCFEQIVPGTLDLTVGALLEMAVALRMISAVDPAGDSRLYYRRLSDGVLHESFTKTHGEPFDLSAERARIVGVLQRIPEARTALSMIRGAHAS
jgi:hypothetical protein